MSFFIKKQLKKQIVSHEELRKVIPANMKVDDEFFKKVESLKKFFKDIEAKFEEKKVTVPQTVLG